MRSIMILLAAGVALPAMAETVKMTTTLTGGTEVPGPGAPDGKGSAELTFDTAKNQVCYMLMSSGTDTPTMAHIHKGKPGVAGGVVVALTAPANGMSQGCTELSVDALQAVLHDPSDYYVNVHTAAFPAGAMRGQLAK
jgi:hypothetical protein